jgi:type IV secretion system protein VirB3
MLLGTFVGGLGWLFSLTGIALALFVKTLCTTDDKAIQILMLEAKWTLIKAISGNASYHGGTLAIAPTSYGRKMKHLKRYFSRHALRHPEKAIRG